MIIGNILAVTNGTAARLLYYSCQGLAETGGSGRSASVKKLATACQFRHHNFFAGASQYIIIRRDGAGLGACRRSGNSASSGKIAGIGRIARGEGLPAGKPLRECDSAVVPVGEILVVEIREDGVRQNCRFSFEK